MSIFPTQDEIIAGLEDKVKRLEEELNAAYKMNDEKAQAIKTLTATIFKQTYEPLPNPLQDNTITAHINRPVQMECPKYEDENI